MYPIRSIAYILFFLACCACQKNTSTESATSPFLELTQEQLKSMEITLAPAKMQALQPIVFATGKVALQPNNQAIISSNIGGKIDRIFVVEGDKIQLGQPLFTITSMPLIELQQSYLAARNDMNFLKMEHERLSILRQSDIASLSEFQQVEAKYLNAKNTEESIREKLKLLGMDINQLTDKEKPNVVNSLVIRSPIAGSVFKEFVTPGSTIEPNTVLADIINLNKIYADIDVYEQDLDQIQLGQEVTIEFINKSISKTTGIVRHIVNSIDPESRAIKLHVDFTAPKGAIVLPEMAVKVKIIGKKAKEKKLTIPAAALLQEGELNYVYYAIPKGGKWEFHKSKVNLGENDGTYTEVHFADPLPAKAEVVQQNVYLIDAENKKRVG